MSKYFLWLNWNYLTEDPLTSSFRFHKEILFVLILLFFISVVAFGFSLKKITPNHLNRRLFLYTSINTFLISLVGLIAYTSRILGLPFFDMRMFFLIGIIYLLGYIIYCVYFLLRVYRSGSKKLKYIKEKNKYIRRGKKK